MRRKRNGLAGIVFGPILTLVALAVIWKNETRFDYHAAAVRTSTITSIESGATDTNISLTGGMDQALTIDGEYVRAFTGYLTITRDAEIYAWDRSEDDGETTWDLRWMDDVESNSRNVGVTQLLSSRRFTPDEYRVGPLPIDSARIEFVDRSVSISPDEIELIRNDLQIEGETIFLRKGRGRNLGDERVRYRAIPVPTTATYFGRLGGGRGVGDTTQARDGVLNQLIRDSGVLHHLVAGDRDTALRTMKGHIERLRWIMRGVGLGGVVLGFVIFFSSIFSVLILLPFVGRLATGGVWLASLLFGVPLALAVMVGGYFAANPIILGVVVIAAVAVVVLLRTRAKSTQRSMRDGLEQEYGRSFASTDVEALGFLELARLALADGELDANERKYLEQWARRQGWDDAKLEAMLAEAHAGADEPTAETRTTDGHLRNLIRLAMVDGRLTSREFRTIRQAARSIGYGDRELRRMIDELRRTPGLAVG